MKNKHKILFVMIAVLFLGASCNGQIIQTKTDMENSSYMQEPILETEPEWSHFIEATVIETESKTIPLEEELTIPTGDEEEIIQWKDPALETMIRKGLNKPDGDILARDVMNIERVLIIKNSYIFIDDSSFDGLSYMDIHEDITRGNPTLPIGKNEWTESLDIYSGHIQYLDDFIYFKGLKKLKIMRNDIHEIRVLQKLTNLDELDLTSNQISNIGVLSGLTNLKTLSLGGNLISDIRVLSDLTELHFLSLYSNDIQDIYPLGELINLQELDLASNPYVPQATSGKHQEMRKEIIDIYPLARLINLTKLRLTDTKLSDIQALSCLKKLIYLDLEFTDVTDFSPLADLVNLQELYFNSTPQIRDINWISNLTNLEILKIANCNVKDISPLSKLVDLRELDLHTNGGQRSGQSITDISALIDMSELVCLRLDGNKVSDISPLTHLTNLQKVDLESNPINDWTPVAHVPDVAGRDNS